ncbi:phosphotransferase [Sphaerisporangium sp. TRM90804]|uniref:phosphotransferase n=1 Tax=Sphaerisporangium sp. TRM90804 TaxID=3031113 RepID=UPI00244C4CEE|nr:phosphotransferase [Sphaerisporangium sp. TRM90804]MDH2425302.1 phosphotransferase [Sphaerisporangium sp. TRM90804]
MRDRPDDLREPELRRALHAWLIDAVEVAHAPVGFGDHHWTATGADGRRWFLTAADLTGKPRHGADADAACQGLRGAMDTAAALRHGGLDFVIAPLTTPRGETVRRVGARYALSVFPFVDGAPGEFGRKPSPGERGRMLDLLARLHRTAPPESTPAHRPELPTRPHLDHMLTATGRPWEGGPYAEPARALVAEHAAALRLRLRRFDDHIRHLEAGGSRPVVTHGEPHPGNVVRSAGRPLLVDWDTVALAPPERDLWLVAEDAADLARYADATGHAPDPVVLALYRLRWALDDVAAFVDYFRSPHAHTPDAELSWESLAATLRWLAADHAGDETAAPA